MLINNIQDQMRTLERCATLAPVVDQVVSLCVNAIKEKKKIIFAGNGGSAADSQHLASELVGKFTKDRKPIASIALTVDSSCLTCIGNDYSFDEIFSRQISALGQKGDIFFGISTSGNSKNIIEAINVCNQLGVISIGLLGNQGGLLASKVDHAVIVPSNITARIQEAHILIGHTICELIEKKLGLV